MIGFAEQRRILRSGAAEVIPSDEFDARLREAIETDRPLRVKLGLDPTAGDVHLGWTVVLRKLRQFQDLGHRAVLIIGDFTAQVGDPSGKSETRKPLAAETVRAYARALVEQFSAVLSMSEGDLEIRYNADWLSAMTMQDVLRLTSQHTVARMLERDDFSKRYARSQPISLVEFLYPLMQGYDSVAVEADVELGGTDQTFNLLVGRDLQERLATGQRPQAVLTMPLLEGTDGVQKMSQSLGNYIGIREPPDEMFGKVMRIPDGLMAKYFRLTTDLDVAEADRVIQELQEGMLHPAQAKRRLAGELVRMYHGAGAASEARERFDRIHRDREVPDAATMVAHEIPSDLVGGDGAVWLPRLIVAVGLARSNAEARRLLSQGGIRLDGKPVATDEMPAESLHGRVLQAGRRSFVRLV